MSTAVRTHHRPVWSDCCERQSAFVVGSDIYRDGESGREEMPLQPSSYLPNLAIQRAWASHSI